MAAVLVAEGEVGGDVCGGGEACIGEGLEGFGFVGEAGGERGVRGEAHGGAGGRGEGAGGERVVKFGE
jgi:hypothetical protein